VYYSPKLKQRAHQRLYQGCPLASLAGGSALATSLGSSPAVSLSRRAPFDGSRCFAIAGGDSPELKTFTLIRSNEDDFIIGVDGEEGEHIVHLSEIEALAKRSAETLNRTAPLSVSANKVWISEFIKFQLQKGASGSADSVASILGCTQKKVGQLANIAAGPSERISEAAKGTCTAKQTEAILALALCNFFLCEFGASTAQRRQVLLGFNGNSASDVAQSASPSAPKKVIPSSLIWVRLISLNISRMNLRLRFMRLGPHCGTKGLQCGTLTSSERRQMLVTLSSSVLTGRI
jgi:hypothetical protein